MEEIEKLGLVPEEARGEGVAALANRSMSWIVEHEGSFVVIFGFFQMWRGVYETWMIPGELFKRYPKYAYKMMKRVLDQIIEHLRPHRLQASILEGQHDHARFICALGFTYEGPLVQYGVNAENYMRYVRIPWRGSPQ